MDNNEKFRLPMHLGNELSEESFHFAEYSNTYRLAAPRYYVFYASYIRPRSLQYKGWMQGFHNIEYGVIPSLFLQKIGAGIINTIFAKPIVMNSENDATNDVINDVYKKKAHFNAIVKEAYGFAEDGGTALIKLNKDGKGDLRFEAIPMDKFFITVDSYGDIERSECFISTYNDTISAEVEYHLCEERFFRYAMINGERKRFPMVHYTVYRTSSNVTYDNVPDKHSCVPWADIPRAVQDMLIADYGNIVIDCNADDLDYRFSHNQPNAYQNCTLLPFNDDLGVRLIKFTNNIPAFPKFPFGEPLASLLMNESYQYDQLKFFERLEVYISRGRAMLPDGATNMNDPEARKSALDPTIFGYYYNQMTGDKEGKPELLQPELRAEAIKAQKQNILNDTAFALNLSSSTIAAWLSDGTTQKTATEIEFERTKTETFIANKVDIIKEPLQDLIDLYFHYYGVSSPEINILPEAQSSRSETVRLYSELFEKKQITAKMLAEKILDTPSFKEVKDLERYIEENAKKSEEPTMPSQSMLPQESGEVENPNAERIKAEADKIKVEEIQK